MFKWLTKMFCSPPPSPEELARRKREEERDARLKRKFQQWNEKEALRVAAEKKIADQPSPEELARKFRKYLVAEGIIAPTSRRYARYTPSPGYRDPFSNSHTDSGDVRWGGVGSSFDTSMGGLIDNIHGGIDMTMMGGMGGDHNPGHNIFE